MTKIKELYNKAKSAKVGEECRCPSCGTTFIKTNYQQAFCKSKTGTICKDKYWNKVMPEKRNNTTRISPASSLWLKKQQILRKTVEGYKVVGRTAYDEFDNPIYDIDEYEDDYDHGQ